MNITIKYFKIQKRCDIFQGENQSGQVKKLKGLSRLTHSCFGRPLDKSECMSNWGNKPLRWNQMRYAALDAFVLIQIHDFIQQKLTAYNVDFDYTQRRQYL